ncbi:exosortase A-associated hydrolase 2 [Inhella inkyongensis]|uniref:Exosortase A-associated hydrolase 2 n=1 Tax=Inhella inkyongensis TaxID=392593 RepID=A0A840RZ10_9BURK|nr:alpha/beta hydrolase [Inhella inkyongensis]MBB5204007.1 exosortase A-associated hydrolase 2 [Inhella inkyongensis]
MRQQPQFLEWAGARRFALLHRPASMPRAVLLLLPPFAEELNKTRRALAQACMTLAEAGFAVLQLDPLGCGDSDGDFGDAGWSDWLNDAQQGLLKLAAEFPDRPQVLWGLRAGCLLGSAVAEDRPQLWWQPATQGKAVLQQFLRLRLAAEMDAAERSTMADLKAQLAQGQPVEVAGYLLSPALAAGLEAAELQAGNGPTLWLEASSQAEPALLPGSQSWLARHPGVQAQALQDPAPWAATELEDSPALTAASLSWLRAQFPA